MNFIKYEDFRQGFPVIIGALTGVSFGTMLGWPSVVYPVLVDPDVSPILITWDQTSLIAGFMMYGNILGAAFSNFKLFGSRIGVLIGCGSQVAGWIIMYHAQDIIGIGFARGLVGAGNGFTLGQLRMYIGETCKPKLASLFLQYMPLSLNFGVVLVYSLGPCTTFRSLSIVCFFVPTIALFLFAAVPKLDYVPSDEDCIATVTSSLETKSAEKPTPKLAQEQLGFIDGLKDREIRRCLFLSWCLIFVPQYTGGAANVVYSQIVHMAALNPYPNVCSIIYALVFCISMFLALKYTNTLPRKPIMVASCIICSLLLCSVCFYFYFMVDLLEVSTHFVWSPLVLLSIFNFFHSVGINIMPILLIGDIYPKNARVLGGKFYLMYFSISAVFSTKIFQVLFTKFGIHVTYAFLSSVALASGVIILCFVREPSDKTFKPKLPKIIDDIAKEKKISSSRKDGNIENTGKYTPYYHGYTNDVDLSDEVCQTVDNNYCSNCRNVTPKLKEGVHELV